MTTAPKLSTVFGSAPDLGHAKRLVADFYCTTPDRITLTPGADGQWLIQSGTKVVDSVRLFPRRGRLVLAAVSAH